MLYDFELAGRRVRLWQRTGESYEHVLMKALGYAMFVREFPALEIEQRVGLRYKPDLVARRGNDTDGADFAKPFAFWGECGTTALRKINWLLKHAGVARLGSLRSSTTRWRWLRNCAPRWIVATAPRNACSSSTLPTTSRRTRGNAPSNACRRIGIPESSFEFFLCKIPYHSLFVKGKHGGCPGEWNTLQARRTQMC